MPTDPNGKARTRRKPFVVKVVRMVVNKWGLVLLLLHAKWLRRWKVL
jgi:hypothetical protein